MTKSNMRKDHSAELRELGFPDEVISEAVSAQATGLFAYEPSRDLVARTVDRCRKLFSAKDERQSEEMGPFKEIGLLGSGLPAFAHLLSLEQATVGLAASLRTAPVLSHLKELSKFERIPAECVAAANFALANSERPWMMVDNHYLVQPSWWEDDTGFRAMRQACTVANAFAREGGAPRALLLMVVRENTESYSEKDIAAISKLVCTTESDVWMVPYEIAGEYRSKDVIVVGGSQVLELEQETESPGEAFGAFQETPSAEIASVQRSNIEKVAARSVRIRDEGRLSAFAKNLGSIEGTRAVLANVARWRAGFEEEF
jgi:hypothetical protein